HGLEPAPLRRGRAAHPGRHPGRRPLLLRPLLLSRAPGPRGLRGRQLRLRRPLPRAPGARRAVGDPVPPREEPGLGAPAAGELRAAGRPRRDAGAGVIVIPAIDLQGGRCVRLVAGRADSATVFGDDPVAWARRWAAEGARRLHVVDLDGAFAGAPRQAALIAAMVAAVAPVPVEVGGGLRDAA